jgi:hypothetical protein
LNKICKAALISAFLIILITSCQAPAAVGTLDISTQTEIPTQVLQSPKNTPTPSVEWKKYQNEAYGFSFEYPALFDERENKSNCGIKQNNNDILLGHRIEISIFDAKAKSLKEFTSEFLKTKAWIIENQKEDMVGSHEGITVDYRFGQSRFGTITLIKNAEMIYAIGITSGSWCEIPEVNFTEPQVYAHLLDTIQFFLQYPTITLSPSP